MMDDGTPSPFDSDGMSKSVRNEMMMRRLSMQALQLNEAIAYLWDSYQDMFAAVDLTDEDTYDKCTDTVLDLEENLRGILGKVQEQKHVMAGYFEPLPDVKGMDDFEAAVLRDIAALDKFDFSVYNKKPVRPKRVTKEKKPSMEDIINSVRKQYYD